MNVDFSLPKGSTTIGKDHINEEVKTYLIETFPEWFVETTVAKEAADLAERLRIAAIIKAKEEGEDVSSNPFESDAMKTTDTSKTVEFVENQEAKIEIRNTDPKAKTKKK